MAGLTNLRSLDLTSNPPLNDITPISGLPNLNQLSFGYRGGMDLSIFSHIPQSVPSPVAFNPPANPHPFAEVLSDFFENLTVPLKRSWGAPYSYHAILVDMDGNGTMGMIASKWYFDGDRQRSPSSWGSVWINPSYTQSLFFMHNGEMKEIPWGPWGVTQSGRLVRVVADGICNMTIREFSLVEIDEDAGTLIPTISFFITEFSLSENYYSVECPFGSLDNYFPEGQWGGPRRSLTREEFNELMGRYGMHDLRANSWEAPDETYTILGMSVQP